MLLRALGIVVLFTGVAAAQTPAAERATRGPDRDARPAARALDASRTPVAGRASRASDRSVRAARASGAARSPAVERVPRSPDRDVLRTTSPARDGAQTPAERASGSLNRDMRADRFRDAARDAREDFRPIRPEVQQFEPQRRTLQPDVGRPEQTGRLSTEGLVGGIPSMGPNPQR